ncbi:MAG TPA: pantetheine-phosphate adenylyltransferase [Bacteroidales bacterium]|nr:pantetheine-phosphate adenylyltransferase [Bacteroidales bacterium]HPS71400.1 pantetheine-phosphate adenylyltransferase [Bacteroidales bacterium]
MKIAVFPGSFDPITKGHEDVINRALPLFDKIIIAIGLHHEKNGFFAIEDRISFINQCFQNPKIEVHTYSGLTGNFCIENNAKFILRGIRNGIDFEYEKDMAQNNKKIFQIDTLFFISTPELSFISSTIVRDLLKHNGDISSLVPHQVKL